MEFHGRTQDFAESGLSASVSATLTVGELVNLRFLLPACSKTFDLRARVLYRNRERYGFVFHDLTAPDMDPYLAAIRRPFWPEQGRDRQRTL